MQPVIPRKTTTVDGKAVVFAKDQPAYQPLPAIVTPDGGVHTEWELTWAERQAIVGGARVQLHVLTFGDPLQPVLLTVEGVEAEPPVGTPR